MEHIDQKAKKNRPRKRILFTTNGYFGYSSK